MYGERDVVDLAKVRELGIPFWLAGGAGQPGRLREAQAAGAAGIQVGTLFAYCDESDLSEELKRSVLEHALRGEVEIYTDPQASPTGYPFKVVRWSADPGAEFPRERVCDLGYLRVAYFTPEGKIDYRCASEPVDAYLRKGGKIEDTVGRRCLCNALLANIAPPDGAGGRAGRAAAAHQRRRSRHPGDLPRGPDPLLRGGRDLLPAVPQCPRWFTQRGRCRGRWSKPACS